ncbi:MAG TPA: endonuclease/exonuclease/phosphatase family protein [Burkholderiales bacterium]|nr:endonuclease/exonuclease/phosphatase family protein [Burkholderiales bacterium]
MLPTRISFITYNIWNTERWAFREPALRKFLEVFNPDVLCLQELRRKSQQVIDEALPDHGRVRDRFIGWMSESNIYWRKGMFAEIEHGAEDVGIKEAGHRRLFWVRLKLQGLDRSILVATAHLTHQRHPAESATGLSPRVAEAKRIVKALKHLNRKREPLFFMGDMNDPVHPTAILHQAGYPSCFAALGILPPTTFKAYPTVNLQLGKPVMNQCIDWLVASREARAICAAVPQFYLNDASPADHWPVHAVYEI